MKPNRSWALYPFLYALFPSLFLYSRNLDWVRPYDLVKPVIVTLAVTAVLLAVLRALLRSGRKAAVLGSTCLILWFSYGHVMQLMQGAKVDGFLLGRTMVVFPAFCILLALIAIAVARTRKSLLGLQRYVSTMGVILVAMSLAQIGMGYAKAGTDWLQRWSSYVDRSCSGRNALHVRNKSKPDIYYIILDNYSRADILKADFGYDNSEFIGFLRSKGFHVADESECNHLGTLSSLPSSLNFNYLDTLRRESGLRSLNKRTALAMIRRSKLVHLLKGAGYKLVTFPSGFSVTADIGADVVQKRNVWSLGEFDRVLINSTMLVAVMNLVPRQVFESAGEIEGYRRDIRHTLAKLAVTPDSPGPKFAFVHIMAAHPPFVFDAEGNLPDVPAEELMAIDNLRNYDPKLYTDSITFINSRMKTVVNEILKRSKHPPVIIIQGDHGASHYVTGIRLLADDKRHAILNAYYLPGGAASLYPSISPVNSFRVVMNTCFGARYPMLKDGRRSGVAEDD